MDASTAYELRCTEQATAARDRLDERRRTAFDRGLAALARDPFPPVSRASGAPGTDRRVRLTRDILVEYTISSRRLVVVHVTAFDETDILVPDVGTAPEALPHWKRQDNDHHPAGSVIYARRHRPVTLIA
ncbi:hypothetical protein [Streptomyces aurantiogriseus]|nr:hypothetical protein [Streptomyces aurantiogriseus]